MLDKSSRSESQKYGQKPVARSVISRGVKHSIDTASDGARLGLSSRRCVRGGWLPAFLFGILAAVIRDPTSALSE